MTQTTGAISMRNNKIEASTNGSSWTDISGTANSIVAGGGEREIEQTPTFDGDTMIVTAGKRGAIELKVRILYTEGASDAAEVARAAYEAGTAYYLRWSPKGGTSTQFMYTSAAGYIKENTYPGGDAKSAEAIALEYTVVTPSITKSVIT